MPDVLEILAAPPLIEPVQLTGEDCIVAGENRYPNNPKPHNVSQEVRAYARGFTDLAIQTLVHIMINPMMRETARVSAANSILDRGWGKSESNVNVRTSSDARELTDMELIDILNRRVPLVADQSAAACDLSVTQTTKQGEEAI